MQKACEKKTKYLNNKKFLDARSNPERPRFNSFNDLRCGLEHLGTWVLKPSVASQNFRPTRVKNLELRVLNEINFGVSEENNAHCHKI